MIVIHFYLVQKKFTEGFSNKCQINKGVIEEKQENKIFYNFIIQNIFTKF